MAIEEAAPDLLVRTTEGSLRIKGTRVTIDPVIQAFNDGATPEEICQDFPSLALAQVYSLFAFYLTHREEVDAYLAEEEQAATVIRQELETRYSAFLTELRQRLLTKHPSKKPRT